MLYLSSIVFCQLNRAVEVVDVWIAILSFLLPQLSAKSIQIHYRLMKMLNYGVNEDIYTSTIVHLSTN